MPEWDMSSLGVMGWGGWRWEEILPPSPPPSSPPGGEGINRVVWGETFPSRLGLRTEISARYYRQTTRMDVPHLFCFHEKCEKSEDMLIVLKKILISEEYSLTV